MKPVLNKPNLQVAVRFVLSAALLATLTSCGSGKRPKRTADKAAIPTSVPMDAAPNNGTAGTPAANANGTTQGLPQNPNNPNAIPQVGDQVTPGAAAGTTEAGAPVAATKTVNDPNEVAAPVGRSADTSVSTNSANVGTSSDVSANTAQKETVPSITESQAITTGGKNGDQVYTSAGDDGLMTYFKSISTTVSKEQQDMNQRLAQGILGAKLRKEGSEYRLYLAVNEFDKKYFYQFRGLAKGDKIELTNISSGGQLELQGGFVKCLDADCNNSYAKIKMSGAYTRIIFRTNYMNRHFLIPAAGASTGLSLWKSYIAGSINGDNGSMKISSIQSSSYEVLNGRSAMGVQLKTADDYVVGYNFPLTAVENSVKANQAIKMEQDLSANYNFPALKPSGKELANAVTSATLVSNNGKGELKIQMKIGADNLGLVLFPVKPSVMTVDQVKAFDSAIKF